MSRNYCPHDIHYSEHCCKCSPCHEEALAKIARLTTALEFYAAGNHIDSDVMYDGEEERWITVVVDRGEKARSALSAKGDG